MFRIVLAIAIATFGFAVMTTTVDAQEQNARLDVFASRTAAVAGGEFDIAIRQTIRDGWHTYWKNAGDSGEPISIEWDAPEGVTLSPMRFPTPHEISYEPLVNYGFAGAPVYLQTVSVADDFTGDHITLKGNAFWLVCDEICIPESQIVSLTIDIASNSQPDNAALFDQAKRDMPQQVDWQSEMTNQDGVTLLSVHVPADLENQFTDVELYPYDWGVMVTNEPAIADIREGGEIIFSKTSGGRDLADVDDPRFVLKTANSAYIVTAALGDKTVPAASMPASDMSFVAVIIFAFIGGLILNLMPCVLPVLSMKALSLVKLSDKERRHAQASGIAYTAGVVSAFLGVAGLLLVFKTAGASIGWGFQLQNPYVVAVLATLLFIIALNLAGFFEISSRFVNLGAKFTRGNDTKASFFTGVLACVVATPCSAPFMASAVGYAMTQSAVVALVVFAVLGFGLAFPYLLLCYLPRVQKILPKPGAWMDTFRQFLAFPMGASAVWLVWVLSRMSGDIAVLYILAAFLSVVFVIWLFKGGLPSMVKGLALIGLVIVFVIYAPILSTREDPAYEVFTQERLDNALVDSPDRPVLVNMTASWCITCLMNERTTLSTDEVKQIFDDNNVLYFKGDWTNADAEITQFLERHGRNGVPLYVYYGSVDERGQRPEAKILPQILTPAIIKETIQGE